ncbi:putative transaldolase [Camellia lanceoleosa]|uniref:Transaldolase n=1 Tax=Camellia lanceoleosa TaxID=1840588 RepID=A0ACC0FEK8_9ERIC|nr:putative transaldolase [Camellia lanceoleosa]
MILGSSSQSAVDTALADSECYGLAGSNVRMSCFVNKALVNVGGELAKVVLGRVSIEVDACLAYDTHSIVRKGIEASRVLESEGIQTHLTFVYSLLVPSHLISSEILNYTENEDFTFSFVHGQDAYSILVLPDDGTSNLQCESQLLFLGYSKVPNSTDGQVCLDAELNGQNYVNLDICLSPMPCGYGN